MTSIRKRRFGTNKQAYVVDYIDLDGKRRLQTFKSLKAAEVFKAAIQPAIALDIPETVPAPAAETKLEPPKQTHAPIDLLWGTEAIAKFIGRTERQVFHLLTTGAIPAKKVGSRWVVHRSTLTSMFS